jgi:predicted glycosyltransferase
MWIQEAQADCGSDDMASHVAQTDLVEDQLKLKTISESGRLPKKRIWVDLDNSPHVPFFIPIKRELEERGYEVLLTARDAYQVSELVEFYGLNCRKIGRHFGKNKFLKVVGVVTRALRLIPFLLKERPDLAVSHGSRAQILASSLLGIKSINIGDYEFVQDLVIFRPSWMIVPEIIPSESVGSRKNNILKYRGIKEDVYVPSFRANPSVRNELGLTEQDMVVSIRPPASEAHYHRPESDDLFYAVMEYLKDQPDIKIVLLPRNKHQEAEVREKWQELISERRVIIPERVVDGLNLIWFSDFVVSGGGTMNREAAALGVPVYSIFRGRIGAVDRYLSQTGRLTLIESPAEIPAKIKLVRRTGIGAFQSSNRPALQNIVEFIVSIVESEDPRLLSPQQAAH